MSATESRKLQLILEWLEVNPGAYNSMKKKLKELAWDVKRADEVLQGTAKTDKEKAKRETALARVEVDRVHAIMMETEGFREADDALKKLAQDEKEEAAAKAKQQREMERQAKLLEKQKKKWTTLGHRISSTGRSLGWLGFRMVIMGRLITRTMLKPVTQVINLLRDWERSARDLAYTIGLLAYTGLGSADMIDTFLNTLRKLPEAGLMIQAALGAVQGVLLTIGVDLAPIISEALIELADAFLRVWKEVSPTLIPALQELSDKVMPQIIDILEELGPAFIEGFVAGLSIVIPALVKLVDFLGPLAPAIGFLAGVLVPLAPLFMLVGTAMYFVSPILMALGSAISFLGPLLGAGGLGGALAALFPVVIAIGAAVLAGVGVFLLLTDVIGPIPAAIIAIVTAIAVGIITFKLVSAALIAVGSAGAAAAPGIAAVGGASITLVPIILALAAAALAVGAAIWMAGEGFKAAATGVQIAASAILLLAANIDKVIPLVPVLLGLAAGMTAMAVAGIAMLGGAAGVIAMDLAIVGLAVSLTMLAGALWAAAAAAEAFNAVGGVVSSIVEGATDLIGGLADALGSLCFKHAAPMAEVFNDVLDTTQRETRAVTRDIDELGSSLRDMSGIDATVTAGVKGGMGGGRGEGGPQYVTIYGGPVTIGSISSEIDLATVREEVSKGIADGVRKRG